MITTAIEAGIRETFRAAGVQVAASLYKISENLFGDPTRVFHIQYIDGPREWFESKMEEFHGAVRETDGSYMIEIDETRL